MKVTEGNAATKALEDNKYWDGGEMKSSQGKEVIAATSIVAKETARLALAVSMSTEVDYSDDWIIDSRCSNHMTGDKKKLRSTQAYRGDNAIVLADNTKLPIANTGKAEISSKLSTKKRFSSTLIMEGGRKDSAHVMPAEKSYIDKNMLKHVACQARASSFWGECLKTAAYVINRLPQPKLGFVSPYQKLWKVKTTVSHFQDFGCVCYVFVPDYLRSKFDKKAVKCIFVGYDNERKGWRFCDPTTNKVYLSWNVVFDEASSWWVLKHVFLPESEAREDSVEDNTGEQPEEEEVRDAKPQVQLPTKKANP
ncbi:hypothetical protein CRG98_000698 [Punica granatum]|uniref:Uncharacterized protein n=1 Tax=Punica granatum TaxID=22663 RepID=A0A2I0LE14_PUNGR|nr:hypothetical protein CRG98_000698 [Punica granatum]